MYAQRWNKIELLCEKALNLKPEDREIFLIEACGDDRPLYDEVKSLLDQANSRWLKDPLVRFEKSFIFSDEALLSEMKIGPYRIIRTIAEGGMGQIYLAVRDDAEFERFVALKVIRNELVDEELLKRFYEERQILASLNHPNIARLFDGGTTSGNIPWYAMEYIEGETIMAYCKRHKLSVNKKIKLFLKVCSAVQYAHQNLVIHRDLKPDNILITSEGVPKLLDFGIARLMNAEKKVSDKQLGHILTPEYASPEQIGNENISTLSDVYSLGVILYELITGELPYKFENRTKQEIEKVIRKQQSFKLSDIAETVSKEDDLVYIVLKALCKNQQDRYVTVEHFANDLVRYQANLPVTARETSLPYRAKKFMARHTWSLAGSVAFFLFIIGFVIITVMQSKTIQVRALEAEQERNTAEQVSQFLIELFESANPSEAGNASITAVELLNRGANRVSYELGNQPELQANLYLVISDVYERMGMYEKGFELSSRALELGKKVYGEQHPVIAKSLNNLGWLHRQLGNYVAADSLLTNALEMRKELFGKQHEDVARSMNDLAVLKQTTGDYTATDTLLQEVIKLRRSLLGKNHESVAVALSNHAALKWRMGNIEAAGEQMRKSLDIFQNTNEDERDDQRLTVVMTNLAAILLTQGKVGEAEKLYRDALKLRLELLGEKHPDVAYSYAHLGNLLRNKGEFEEAEKYLTIALELHRSLLGDEHILVGDSQRVLGYLYESRGDYSKAEKNYLEAIHTFSKIFPKGHARTAQVMQRLGKLYLNSGRLTASEEQLKQALSIRESIFGDHHPLTLETMIYLGNYSIEAGEFKSAEKYILTAVKDLNNLETENEELKNMANLALSTLQDSLVKNKEIEPD